MDELRDKIARLPTWVREHIKRLEVAAEPAIEEVVRSRRKIKDLEERCRRLSEQVEAMTEMFRSAAIGGNDGAKVVVSILEGYEIFQKSEEVSSGS